MNHTVKIRKLSEIAPRFSKNNFLVYLANIIDDNQGADPTYLIILTAYVIHYTSNPVSKKILQDNINDRKMMIQRCADAETRDTLNFELRILKGAIDD